MEKYFDMQKGEKIIEDIKPLPVLKWFFFITYSIGFLFFILFFLWFMIFFGPLFLIFSLFILVILVIIYLIIYFVANNKYKYQHYWITTERIIYRRGLIGYTISSIPLERISDVIVSRTFIERIFGFGSILVQSLAGQVSYPQRHGAEGSLLAIPNPEETQKLIFELIKKKRKTEKLSF